MPSYTSVHPPAGINTSQRKDTIGEPLSLGASQPTLSAEEVGSPCSVGGNGLDGGAARVCMRSLAALTSLSPAALMAVTRNRYDDAGGKSPE